MCNVYGSLSNEELEALLELDDRLPWEPQPVMGPFAMGAYVGADMLPVLGQWGMIPPNSPERIPRAKPKGKQTKGARLSTNNARRERMATAFTFRRAWLSGRRCLIPARWYQEPYWGGGVHVAWRFSRADGEPWMLAGLYDTWTDPVTGEIVPNYTMVTQNCDGHPLLALMHKPEVDRAGAVLPAEQQDKRSVVPIERADWLTWLAGSSSEAAALIRVPEVELFRHGPADPSSDVRLPL
ncbi:SOS response-associated peptidase family protein [Hydrogenophaga sp.]|uniref:SOS response-associated peptidase family protein n=1 Tax=Hydrogenophaga sp. TaxID=1904254 RepID=UPI002626AF2B|nr:SOS response-associated peptidase family protein [Hydrogenophaga sp.]